MKTISQDQLKMMVNGSIDKAYKLSRIYGEDAYEERIIALVTIAEATKKRKYLDEARLVAEKMILVKYVQGLPALSAIARYSKDKQDIKKVFDAAEKEIKEEFDGGNHPEWDDTDPIYYHAKALRNASREYARYDFIKKANELVGWSSDQGYMDSFKQSQIFLGIWEATKDETALLVARTLARTNPCIEYRLKSLLSILELTHHWIDEHPLDNLIREEKDGVKQARIMLETILAQGHWDEGWIDEASSVLTDRDDVRLLIKVCIQNPDSKLCSEIIEKHKTNIGPSSQAILVESYIREGMLDDAERLAQKISSSCMIHSSDEYTTAAQHVRLTMTKYYLALGKIDKVIDWLTKYESDFSKKIKAIEIYLLLSKTASDLLRKSKAEWKPE